MEEKFIILGNLTKPDTYQELMEHEVWRRVFVWLHAHQDALPEDGEYEVDGRDVRAIVQTLETKPRSERVFEAHRREIDLQYCYAGSEIIECAPEETLQEVQQEYDAAKDVSLYTAPASAQRIHMTPGSFVIFFPGDAHMPGIVSRDPQTRKVVVKINADLVDRYELNNS